MRREEGQEFIYTYRIMCKTTADGCKRGASQATCSILQCIHTTAIEQFYHGSVNASVIQVCQAAPIYARRLEGHACLL